MNVKTELNQPIIFRTVSKEVYYSTMECGSVWLRSNRFYQKIEDITRRDDKEGINTTQTSLGLNISSPDSPPVSIIGDGHIGCEIVPHYIMSMHGTAIKKQTRDEFGKYTLGIKNLFKLSIEVCHQVSQQIPVHAYRYGQVSYQHTALTVSDNSQGAAISTGELSIRSINTDALRKPPIEPFTLQDEWRIVIFTEGFLEDDPEKPIKINVSPEHFYDYHTPE
ncbi:hypothetical protein [Thalassospira profundimaris]|uniref:hypothetical protein n=1 Tax=Thalassospira profundimaris TaxID=502049 RepID=UPI000DED3A77|nr:hypothetical protein [Thalassospira profundimaris]